MPAMQALDFLPRYKNRGNSPKGISSLKFISYLMRFCLHSVAYIV